MEYVIYYIFSARFGLLGDALPMQLHCSQTRHQESYDMVCQLLKNPVFYPV